MSCVNNVSFVSEVNTGLDTDDMELSFQTRFGSPIKFYDDGIGKLFIMRNSMGIVGIVRAQTWEDAYSISEDELLPVISGDELPDAYGFNSQQEYDKAVASEDTRNNLELSEGYSYQSNATGTGIVSHDLNGESLDLLTLDEITRLDIRVIITFKE